MANKLLFSTIAISFFLILFSQSFAQNASLASTSTICKSTPYPSFCKSVLPNKHASADVYDYGRSSVRKSLSLARKFVKLVEKYLHHSRAKYLTKTAIRALEDCKFLAELNLDFLSSSFKTVNQTSKSLPLIETEDVQTLLSAILTNTQTCLDGLQATASAWSVRNGLVAPLSNNTRLYSVSLALFTKGWVPKAQKTRPPRVNKKQLSFHQGRLPFKMSAKHKAIFETVGRRNLAQINNENSDSDSDADSQILVNDIVIVSQDGIGNFTTINEAVAVAPNTKNVSEGYFLIYIMEGVYEEYVSIGKKQKYVMMIGDGINKTIITGNHSFVDGWTTFNSSTFAVVGEGFVAMDITFRNTAGAIKHQAVAVRNGADLSTFYRCSFEGYQDTLYVHSLRQFYRECDIYGTVDFIFGNAASVFQNCNIYPRLPLEKQFNAITAQGRTDPNQNTGISIHNCTIRAADDLASSNSTVNTYLGRPWKEYSRSIFMQSFIDNCVHPSGWREWSGDFALNTSYYAEFDNYGPGSNTSGRVTWPGVHILNATDAGNFTTSSFLLGDDWLPQTGVPYAGGLS